MHRWKAVSLAGAMCLAITTFATPAHALGLCSVVCFNPGIPCSFPCAIDFRGGGASTCGQTAGSPCSNSVSHQQAEAEALMSLPVQPQLQSTVCDQGQEQSKVE